MRVVMAGEEWAALSGEAEGEVEVEEAGRVMTLVRLAVVEAVVTTVPGATVKAMEDLGEELVGEEEAVVEGSLRPDPGLLLRACCPCGGVRMWCCCWTALSHMPLAVAAADST